MNDGAWLLIGGIVFLILLVLVALGYLDQLEGRG